MPVSRRLAAAVLRRARFRSEYCQIYGWPLTIDRVLPRSAGGGDDPANLAAACFPCNRLKGAHTESEDPLTGESVALFNPRQDDWDRHFAWSLDFLDLYGRTPVGRATAALLRFNKGDRRLQRQLLRASAHGGGLPWP